MCLLHEQVRCELDNVKKEKQEFLSQQRTLEDKVTVLEKERQTLSGEKESVSDTNVIVKVVKCHN